MSALSFDPGLFFWSLATFAGLLGLLAKFTFRPLRRILQERERRIRESIEKAEEAQRKAEETLALNDGKLREAREEARRIIGDGHRLAAEIRTQAQVSAREEAGAIVDHAREEIDRQLQRSLDELKGSVANLSIRIARQIIREETDEKRHAEMADSFIERLKQTHGKTRRG